MRKILTVLTGVSLLATLLLPMTVMAQVVGPPGCCKLKRPATEIDAACTADMIVGGEKMDKGTGLGQCPVGAVPEGNVTPHWGACCIMSNIKYAVDLVFFIFLLFAVIFIILGGFQMLMSQGYAEKFATGRTFVMYALIAVAVAFGARVIPAVARWIIGV